MMIAPSTSLNSSLFTTYNRSGQGASLLRSEPVQRVVVTPATKNGTEQAATDSVSLSAEGLEKSRQSQEQEPAVDAASEETTSQQETQDTPSSSSSQALTPEEQQMVQELKQRDTEVKTHEMAHLAVAGQYASGGASYTYQQGPDGRRYAIGGEVPIDLSAEKTPEATIAKMRTIKRAAMAPAEPSSADRSVAATATAMENSARQEVQTQETEAPGEQNGPEKADDSIAEASDSAETNETAQSSESSETSGSTEGAATSPQTTRAIDVVA